MINQEEEFLGVDKNSGFALRVLILSVPAGLIFLILGLFDILSTPLAALSYICILFFNTVFLMPISIELQQIKKYILSLSSGANEEKLLSNLTEKETRDLTEAINSMHKFWVDKTGMLENRTLSDAAVLDTLPDPLLMINKQGAVIGANLAARTLFETGLNGREIREFIPDANFNATLSKVLAGQSRHEEMNLCLADRRDKPKFYLRISTIPWFAKGEVIAVISFYDLHKALQLEQMQQDFVTNASHETAHAAFHYRRLYRNAADHSPRRRKSARKIPSHYAGTDFLYVRFDRKPAFAVQNRTDCQYAAAG